MKICWDNLNNLRYDALHDEFVSTLSRQRYFYVDVCKCCKDPFLAWKYNVIRPRECCSIECANKVKVFSAHRNQLISKAMQGEKHPMYGRHHSEEAKSKIGNANRGHIHTDEVRQRISESQKGPKNHFYGKHNSKRVRKIISEKAKERFKDPRNHPNWRGGISCEPYCAVWLDKEFKESIKERDNYQCQNPNCWETSKRLTVHHIDYNKKNCVPSNLITLCNSCNMRANFNRNKWKGLFIRIIEERRRIHETSVNC